MKQFDRVLFSVICGILFILIFATRAQCQIIPDPTNAQTLNDGAPITLGLRFVPKKDMRLVGIRFWKRFPGSVIGTLWEGNRRVVSAVFKDGSGWVVSEIAADLESGKTYTVSYSSALNNYSYAPIPISGNQNVDYIASAYIYQEDNYPISSNGSNYLVEPLLESYAESDTVYIRDTVRVTDTVFMPVLCPDTTWVFADGYDTVGARFPDYQIYGQFEFTMPLNKKVRFVRRIEAVWRREEFINGQWVEK